MKKTIISILAISIVSIASIFSNINNSFANTYEKTINPTFTINDTLTLSLSSSDLVINDLMPGNASDSNIITINVLSNNPYGYTLNSTVGGTSGTVTYNNRDLNYTGTVPSGSTAPSFTSLDYGSSVSSLNEFGSNQWGYSYLDTTLNSNNGSNSNGDNSSSSNNTWSNYSGLPLYTDETNIATLKQSNIVSAISGDNIEFKLGARADNTQGSGEYRNIINFIVTGAPEPPKTLDQVTYMQDDFSCEATAIGTTNSLIDLRDNQAYSVAKLADGRCWMTTNLNLAGNTEIEYTKSDVSEGYVLPTTNGFQSGNRLPVSSTIGFSNNVLAYVYNSNNATDNCSSPGCYSYYSWVAATAGSGLNVSTDYTNALYSICPKGWRLPIANRSNPFDASIASKSEFYKLATTYGVNLESSYTSNTPTFYNNLGPNTIAKFLLSGGYVSSNFYGGGTYGSHWSSTSGRLSNYTAIDLGYDTSPRVGTADTNEWRAGFTIRCVHRQ